MRALALDAADGAALRRALEPVDVVCNCAGHATNLRVMQASADAGCHYVDLGGRFQTTGAQLTLHDRFVAAGVTAVIGMGASPGTSNVLAALAASRVAAQLLARKVIDQPGVLPPERAVPPGPYLDELARRQIEVSVTARPPDLSGSGPTQLR